jgi:hypothetical protein
MKSTVYKFRVSFEDYEDIYRDIEIKPDQTFEDLHLCIQSSIGFDGSKPASFFMSNDYWVKGVEISTENKTNKKGEKVALMRKSRLCDFIADPHQKIYYEFDTTAGWTFFIELVKIIPATQDILPYPRCVKFAGDAPKQYNKVEPIKDNGEFDFLNEEQLENGVADEEEISPVEATDEAVEGVEEVEVDDVENSDVEDSDSGVEEI